jgi:maltose alpha-D-glucosyltransferase/alpha-amylase
MATTLTDYTSISPVYDTLEDFKGFLAEAHRRNPKLITELVINHTSDQRPWFQEARSSRNNLRRDWYVWSDTDRRCRGVGIIFKDSEPCDWAWETISKSYYGHLASIFQPSARPELRQSCSPGRGLEGHSVLGRLGCGRIQGGGCSLRC